VTRILAIDPGTAESAWMVLEDGLPFAGDFGKAPNAEVRILLLQAADIDAVVIEEVRSYGMPVGREVFDTVRWCGRFEEAALSRGIPVEWLGRKDVGGDSAKGTKRSPGVLYGVAGDVWSALGVGVTWFDQHAGGDR
jgi:hypothetical protein